MEDFEDFVRAHVPSLLRTAFLLSGGDGPAAANIPGVVAGLDMLYRKYGSRNVTWADLIAPAIEYHEYHGQGNSLDEMYESKEQARQDTAILHVHPSHFPPHIFFCCDPDDAEWHRGADRLHEKLSALGIAHECDLTTRAGGHTWDYYNAMAGRLVRFLVDGLEHDSRRLL